MIRLTYVTVHWHDKTTNQNIIPARIEDYALLIADVADDVVGEHLSRHNVVDVAVHFHHLH